MRYPSRGRQVEIVYSSDAAAAYAYWGVWINTGGWAGHKHVAIEPTMGRYDALDRSVRDGSAGRVSALGNLSWSVSWTLGPIDGV